MTETIEQQARRMAQTVMSAPGLSDANQHERNYGLDVLTVRFTKELQSVHAKAVEQTRKETWNEAGEVAHGFFERYCDGEADYEKRGKSEQAKICEYQSWSALNIRDALFTRAQQASHKEQK